MLPYAYKLINKFQLEEEGIGNIFCGILDPVTVQDCTKFPSVITHVLRLVTRGGRREDEAPQEKCVGHSLKSFDNI